MTPELPCDRDWQCEICGMGALELYCLGDYEPRYVEQHDFEPHYAPGYVRKWRASDRTER